MCGTWSGIEYFHFLLLHFHFHFGGNAYLGAGDVQNMERDFLLSLSIDSLLLW